MVTETECHRCGYEWEYGGEKDLYATCPNCKTSTKLGGSEGGSNDGGESRSSGGSLPSIVNPITKEEDELGNILPMMMEQVYSEVNHLNKRLNEIEGRLEAREEVEEIQNEQIDEMYEVVEELVEATGGSVEWDHEPYDPTEEFEE